MTSNPRYSNGARRRKDRAILLSTTDVCYLCGLPIDKTITDPCDPRYPVIDEVVPISKGGRLTLDNERLVHRACNARKSDKILAPPTMPKPCTVFRVSRMW